MIIKFCGFALLAGMLFSCNSEPKDSHLAGEVDSLKLEIQKTKHRIDSLRSHNDSILQLLNPTNEVDSSQSGVDPKKD